MTGRSQQIGVHCLVPSSAAAVSRRDGPQNLQGTQRATEGSILVYNTEKETIYNRHVVLSFLLRFCSPHTISIRLLTCQFCVLWLSVKASLVSINVVTIYVVQVRLILGQRVNHLDMQARTL